MAHFDAAIRFVLAHEGGFSDDPVDPGGITNYGISLRFLIKAGDLDRDGVLDGDIDGDGDVDADDIRAMTKAAAGALYRLHFWDRYGYSQVVAQQIATKIFDTCVNMGPGRAHRIAQTAVNRVGSTLLKVDGAIGPKTIAGINGCFAPLLMGELRSLQWEHYRAIIAGNPPLVKYENGWRRRAFS